MTFCDNCQDARWVCATHTDQPWEKCEDNHDLHPGGAADGRTCPVCNPKGLYPGLPEDAKVIAAVDEPLRRGITDEGLRDLLDDAGTG